MPALNCNRSGLTKHPSLRWYNDTQTTSTHGKSTRLGSLLLSALFTRSVLAVCIFALSACSFAPKYEKPSVATKDSDAWSKKPWVQAQPSDYLDKGEWWRLFHDETLSALENALNVNSPSLAIALARYDQATAYLRQTQSQALPSIDAGASTTQNRQSHNRPLRGSNQPDYYNAYTGMLGTNYELDFWGRVRGLVAAAKAQAQSSASDLQTEKLSLQSRVAQIYMQLRGADKQIAMLADTVKAYERAYVLIKNRYDVGVASGIDLARAQTQLSSAQAEVSELAIERALYVHAIAALIGEPAQTFTINPLSVAESTPVVLDANADTHSDSKFSAVQQSLRRQERIREFGSPTANSWASMQLSEVPEVPLGLPSTLLERRPDVASAERKAAAANQRIGVAKAAFYPSFYFGAAAGYQNTGGPAWLSEPNSVWSIGPSAAFNLFDAGLREAQLSQAKSALNQAGAEYRLVVLAAYQQVEDALSKLGEYKVEIQNRAAAADAAVSALQIATSRYKDGAVNYLDVVTAQTAALQAQRSLLFTDTARLLTSIDLIKALGGGWSSETLKIGQN